MEGELIYFNCLKDNYNNIKHKCEQVCIKNKETFSEDILNDTVIQIHKIIKKKGKLNDMSLVMYLLVCLLAQHLQFI